MRNIAALDVSPPVQPSLTSHDRLRLLAGLKSLRAYRLHKIANRTLPSQRPIETGEAA